jgi:predicted xylose isomerase-like sugar epimerase
MANETDQILTDFDVLGVVEKLTFRACQRRQDHEKLMNMDLL